MGGELALSEIVQRVLKETTDLQERLAAVRAFIKKIPCKYLVCCSDPDCEAALFWDKNDDVHVLRDETIRMCDFCGKWYCDEHRVACKCRNKKAKTS